ncbi:Hypothetical Protein FCC1311_045922 [Hondaea fermentalgiana]|uniref:Uncharacterized protein n=1 Tax=Hondaea fermentalgiana TaxID=2315210 RepID=A0A2R5GDJ3_9STRA|nr:Hypothetical Protein FCC1311_045922 [Hondaea fermentalgiana]|eukprot:GBG28369.1 Hypothetical Protein FCC1311_045922 [Hondaea fermentalgiana]
MLCDAMRCDAMPCHAIRCDATSYDANHQGKSSIEGEGKAVEKVVSIAEVVKRTWTGENGDGALEQVRKIQ